MTAIEIARRLAELGDFEKASASYAVAANGDLEPSELMEAALFLLEKGKQEQLAFTIMVQLHGAGYYRRDIPAILEGAFYAPNVKPQKKRYERNVALLEKYPYLFRKDFPSFEALPLAFFPFDDHGGYVSFHRVSGEFEGFTNPSETVISRNFFRDLEKPILAEDVFSQYELEYLRDNVRRSEDVGRENHVYLHYADWERFCSWLAVLNVKPLLEDQKLVFLFGDELSIYPIDFKARFGIDYDAMPLRPVRIREVTRLIWHTQLSAHNGGDFFNEIFDSHPNLYAFPSVYLSNINETAKEIKDYFNRCTKLETALEELKSWNCPELVTEMFALRDRKEKDAMVLMYMRDKEWNQFVDRASRIAPALFFQPHFNNIDVTIDSEDFDSGNSVAVLDSTADRAVHDSALFRGFKYIKTFTPLRRITTSYGATLRYSWTVTQANNAERDGKKYMVLSDACIERTLNRCFLRDPEDRLYKDSIIVRFEDGKTNPRATLSRLAAFLDLPYTQSMTYCSEKGKRDPLSELGEDLYAAGFNLTSVYKTYDAYAGDCERKFLEYFFRDAYQYYGYDFHYYDGGEVEEGQVMEWIDHFDLIDQYLRKSWAPVIRYRQDDVDIQVGTPEEHDAVNQAMSELLLEEEIRKVRDNRKRIARFLLRSVRFCNKRGRPLEMTPMIEPDPDLLDMPLYH